MVPVKKILVLDLIRIRYCHIDNLNKLRVKNICIKIKKRFKIHIDKWEVENYF